MVSKNSADNIKSAIVAVIGGMAAANYLTPALILYGNIKEPKIQNGLAFVIGFIGLKLVEIVSSKLLQNIEQTPIKVVRRPVKRKAIKRK